MSVVSAIIGQFRQPRGLIGSLVGRIMATRPSNRQRNQWTVDLLDIQPTERVLEIGYGPGLAVERISQRLTNGLLAGIDHSSVMLRQATRRNRAAIKAGRVALQVGGLEALPRLAGPFDKVLSINVAMFWPDRRGALSAIAATMRSGGTIATTYQPRHPRATAQDATAFAQALTADLAATGFGAIRIEHLPLEPVPAICVLATRL